MLEVNEQRKIIHIDMDAFYVSVEIRDQPTLLNQPVAVGGKSNTRSVLSTCNYIARQYGVRSAMPAALALKKCPNLIILPGRMNTYKEVSTHIHKIFHRYTDIIEPLSLDEAYLDVSNCKLFNGSATLIAEDIRSAIFQELNLTASAGIAPLKYLAKIASDLNKPNGQYVIPPNKVIHFIETMPLNKIPGVGRVSFEKLQKYAFLTGQDIRKSNEAYLSKTFGKLGRSLWFKCQGIDNRTIETTRVRKSVGVEKTFSYDIDNQHELENILLNNLLPELHKRSEKYLKNNDINKLGIKIKFKDFQQTTKEFKFDHFGNAIFLTLLNEAIIRGKGKPVRLLGVHIGITKKTNDTQQLPLALDE